MNTIENYWVLSPTGGGFNSGVIEEEYSVIGGVLDIKDLNKGKALLSRITEPLKLQFNKDYPKEWNKLYDFVDNRNGIAIISNRIKEIFENAKVTGLEYIPSQILNQEGAIIGEDYSVLNILNRQPIVDIEKSEFSTFLLSPQNERVDVINDLRLDVSNVDLGAKLFLGTTDEHIYFMVDDLLQKMKAAKVTGLEVNRAEGWDGFSFFDAYAPSDSKKVFVNLREEKKG